MTGHNLASGFPAKARKRGKHLKGRRKEQRRRGNTVGRGLVWGGHMRRRRNNSERTSNKKCIEGG